jgi:CRISPR-associated protein Cmr2
MADNNKMLVSFSIGPVQDFIAAARTTRDLWIGSRLLTILTAAAIKIVRAHNGSFIFPSIKPDGDLPESLPNTFVAEIDAAQGPTIVTACRQAALDKWLQISERVRDKIQHSASPPTDWDAGWDDQVRHYWDIRVLSVPVSAGQDPAVIRLLGEAAVAGDAITNALRYLNKLAAASKQIRHYPPHEPDGRDGPVETRAKCSLLGSLAQMGPRQSNGQHAASTAFWQTLCNTPMGGIRIGTADRLCAVSLVKRFAPAVLQGEDGGLRFPDVDTICATHWLEKAQLQDLPNRSPWSGHWLRWRKQLSQVEADEQGETPCPEGIWHAIQAARREHGAPPAYYAVVMVDGDSIGQQLASAGRDEVVNISAELNRFATQMVPDIVKQSGGTLVYAGGDDVLALLPTQSAVDCACELSDAFGQLNIPPCGKDSPPTISAGIAVVHYKENLRLALAAARRAEARAKGDGRNRLALTVIRRSGSRDTLSLNWNLVGQLSQVSQHFCKSRPASDRWAYQFQKFLDTVGPDNSQNAHIHNPIIDGELRRLLARSENTQPEFLRDVLAFWHGVQQTAPATTGRPAAEPPANVSRTFIDGIMAASFIARTPKE